MSALRITIGADPELFVRNKKTGLFVSAHDLMPGTKDAPHKVDLGAIQVDGVAAEFNIDPTESAQQFVTNISAVTGQLSKIIGTDYELVSQPTCVFPEDYFKSLPDHVRELGCNADYNAWTGQVTKKPDGDSTTMRTGAGHIHIGWCEKADPGDPIHFDDCAIIAKQLDYYLGMYSLRWDQDTKRRSLYGKAGCFRAKPYGMEYRSLSNVWLGSSKLQSWVWNAAQRAVVDLIQNGNRVEDKLGDIAQRFIDGNEVWWEPSSQGKSDDHKKAFQLSAYTNLNVPPALPKPKTPEELKAEANKPKPKHSYGTVSGGRRYFSQDLQASLKALEESGIIAPQGLKYSPSTGMYFIWEPKT